jgi:uncharacterized protein DUF3352
MRLRHAIAAALACAVLTILVGCGGTSKTGVSGAVGASLVRSGALAYVAVDTDLHSSQWQKVDDLLHKFPGRDKWLAQLRAELPDKLSYKDDIAPALGPEVDVAVVSGTTPEQTSAVLLTKPESLDKARALARKLASRDDAPSVTRVVDGWFVAAESAAMIDRTLKGDSGKSLADDPTFKEAVDALPTDALAKAYVNGRQLADLVGNYVNRGPQTAAAGRDLPFGLDKLDWISASLEAKDDGIRFETGVKGAGGADLTSTAAPYASKLISGVPAGALAFLTFQGGSYSDQLRKLRDNPQFGSGFDQFERATGLRLDDVLELFAHEVAFYVRRGVGLPEFSLALEQPETAKALATLDRVAARVAALTQTRVREEQRGGVKVKSLTIGGRVTVEWAGFGGRVLLTTGPTGIADYRAGGDKLADDPDYKDALATTGVPDKTGGLVYLNLHDGLQLIQNYLGLSGENLPADLRANLKPLRALVAYSTKNGDLTKLAAFLELK